MKLEAGKYYLNAEGKKVGPMVEVVGLTPEMHSRVRLSKSK